jgi:hypothetical protein
MEIHMSVKITIPARVLMQNTTGKLELSYPLRCSRCNAPRAEHRETHILTYEAGLILKRQFGKRFRSRIKFEVRLPLCETCAKADFIEAPESYESEAGRAGKLARWRSRGMNLGAAFAAAAFILLMKIIPLPESLPWLQYLWLMLIGVGLVIFGLTFGLLELENQRLRKELAQAQYDVTLHRADVFGKAQVEDAQPNDPAVTIQMENESWAQECAAKNGWPIEHAEETTD